MPIWGQVILACASLVIAVGVLWTKALKPGARIVTSFEEMLPVARELTEQFKDAPEAFSTLADIAAQFHTDSGTTLRDVINRLEAASIANEAASAVLRINVETARLLAEEDRTHLAEAISLLRNIRAGVGNAAMKADGIADDLEASQGRARATEGDSGAAADAASKGAHEDP